MGALALKPAATMHLASGLGPLIGGLLRTPDPSLIGEVLITAVLIVVVHQRHL